MLRLYLVRHGQTAWNATGRIQGHSDVPLDEVGLRQAQQVARWLGERVKKPVAIYTSDLARASQTAEAIAQQVGASVAHVPDLRERFWGAWEGLTTEEIQTRYPDHHFTYLYDPLNGTPPEAEPMNDFWARVRDFHHRLRTEHTEGELILVGHGGSLRILLCETLLGNVHTYRRIRLDNTSVSIVEHTHERAWVALLNFIEHLQDPSVDGF